MSVNQPTAAPTPKVTVGTVAAALTFLLTFLLSHYVFHGSLTAAEQSVISGVSPVVVGFVAAYIKKNDVKLVTDVDTLAVKVAAEVQKYQPEVTALEPAVFASLESDPRLAGVLRRLESIANALGTNVPVAAANPVGAATEPFKAPVGATAPAPVPPAARAGRVGVTVNENLNPTGFDPEVK